jgi:beta-fructofuranosidase
VRFQPGTRGCGLMLRASKDYESAYYLRLEPSRQRLVFDSWPRSGDVPFAVELERPLKLAAGQPVHLTVLIDGTVCVTYAGGTVAMNTRLYNLKEGEWGVFVEDGEAAFSDAAVYLE